MYLLVFFKGVFYSESWELGLTAASSEWVVKVEVKT